MIENKKTLVLETFYSIFKNKYSIFFFFLSFSKQKFSREEKKEAFSDVFVLRKKNQSWNRSKINFKKLKKIHFLKISP
jgi:hypothetical protein